ncbi:heme-binding protein [Mycobacterium sp. pUA109]|uniref:heme-binding protein n=1 Tax=Mycobacterium sp. pUA109 TaxID=3238982 RepID=UPI00351B965A
MTDIVRHVASVTNATALRIVHAAITAAEDAGVPAAIAVVDAAGHLSAFARMDGCVVQAIQVSQDKAYTAAGFGMATNQWHEVMQQDAPLAQGAPAGMDRLITFGGGVPINVDGQVVGGIGVSGGHWSQDHQIAQAGLQAIG